jgi:uncharacterized membrane protein
MLRSDEAIEAEVGVVKEVIEMAELIVVGFKGTGRAADMLDQLQGIAGDWTVDLQDAVAVYRDNNGTLRLDENTEPTEEQGAGMGALWGGLLGVLIAIPFTSGAAAAATAAALATGALGGGALGAATGMLSVDWWRNDFGLTEDFVRSVSAMIQPGDSAIFALLRTANPKLVADQFRGYGGKILQTTLTPEQSKKLQQILDGHKVAI